MTPEISSSITDIDQVRIIDVSRWLVMCFDSAHAACFAWMS
jgi:hypothetical protein